MTSGCSRAAASLASTRLPASAATFMLGWKPHIEPGRLALALVLGTIAFSGIGMFLAGTLRAEANLGIVNGLFLLLIMLGGTVVAVDRLPGFLGPLARALPAAALTGSLGRGVERIEDDDVVVARWERGPRGAVRQRRCLAPSEN